MREGSDREKWLSEIDLDAVFSMFRDNGVTEILFKVLPQNANSKNQVYLGGKDPSEFAKIPTGDMVAHVSTSVKSGVQEAVFHAALDFHWLTEQGGLAHAPHAKLIFYPQYPEVRFSGFLRGCRDAPAKLWSKDKRGTEPGRILLLGLGNGSKVIGLTLPPEAPAAREIIATGPHPAYEVMSILAMPGQRRSNGFDELMSALCNIHGLDWVNSRRLDPSGAVVPCAASNCNGNTLEALLGIRSNGHSLPDFMGWEVKARQVRNVDKPRASVVTLFTPEPVHGVYVDAGIEAYIRRYGYMDKKGRQDRLNVGGIYKATKTAHPDTGLRLVLDGFDPDTMAYAATGGVLLIDRHDNVAAGWPFAKLLDHWKIKHAHAAFVPCQVRRDPQLQYRYGRTVLLGEGAEFKLLLNAFQEGKVYYDPGIKLEDIHSPKPIWKKRSQFRTSSLALPSLYRESRTVDVCERAAGSSATPLAGGLFPRSGAA